MLRGSLLNLDSLPATPDTLAKLKQLRGVMVQRQRQETMAETERFFAYRLNPVGFVQDKLGEYLWSKQREIMESVVHHRRTAVPSCHDSGKSFTAARVAAHFLSVWPPGDAFAVTTAPTFDQVRAILWREINRTHRKGRLPGRTNQTEWFIGEELVAMGRKPDEYNPTAFQGIHAPRVLLVLDEACGVPRALWDAADTLIANEDSRALAIGNPDDPLSEFANVCKPGSGWNVITIDGYDTPNFTGEYVPEEVTKVLLSKTWVEEKKRKWGETSPMYKAKVRGEFSEERTDGLISVSALRAAVARKLEPTEPNELGVDIARQGHNFSVIYHRRGPVARKHDKFQIPDLMKVVGRIVAAINETGAKTVKIDAAGMGWGPSDRLRELKHEGAFKADIIPINVGEAAATTQSTERFQNLRAELNWGMRERIQSGDIDLEDDEDTLAQASAITYWNNSRGQICIISKEDMQKPPISMESPDDWDALVLAFAKPNYPGSGVMDYYARLTKEAEQEKHNGQSQSTAAR